MRRSVSFQSLALTNIAETVRRNASQVRTLFAKLGILKLVNSPVSVIDQDDHPYEYLADGKCPPPHSPAIKKP